MHKASGVVAGKFLIYLWHLFRIEMINEYEDDS
jgi:hypothetical protein